jgi:hypothetical protein
LKFSCTGTPSALADAVTKSATSGLRSATGTMWISSRRQYGSISWYDHPAAPAATQSAKSPGGGSRLIIVLCDEQPPSTLAREWTMCELPRGCGTVR